MSTDETRRRAWRWRSAALQAATFVILIAGSGASAADQAGAPARAQVGAAESTSDDPCRFATAEAMGSAFGRPLTPSRLVDVCKYRGAGTDIVFVKVAAGREGPILRHLRGASARGQAGAEKVSTAVGEAYFDSTLPVFVGRVGNHEVQIETTIEPLPRDAMIAVGTRMMETLARE